MIALSLLEGLFQILLINFNSAMEVSVKLICCGKIKVAFGIFETQRNGNVSSLNNKIIIIIVIIIITFNTSIAQISIYI